MVHSRQVGEAELVFGNQGALWGNAMTWWDHDTGSVWSQPLGEAIAGPRTGQRLELLPSTLTTWGAWLDSHPETRALDAPAPRSGFRLEDMAIVVELADDTAAFPVRSLRKEIANDVIGGVPVAIVVNPAQPDEWTVFSRTLDDRTVELVIAGTAVVDKETGTVWDPVRGDALSGQLQGTTLDILPGFTSFVRDYWTFWPDGRVWEPSAG